MRLIYSASFRYPIDFKRFLHNYCLMPVLDFFPLKPMGRRRYILESKRLAINYKFISFRDVKFDLMGTLDVNLFFLSFIKEYLRCLSYEVS